MNGVTFSALPRGLMCSIRSRSYLLHDLVAEGDHLGELPAGVHMQEREGYAAGIEGLARQMQQHGGILADRIEHHRTLEFGRHFAENVDGLRFPAPSDADRAAAWCSADWRVPYPDGYRAFLTPELQIVPTGRLAGKNKIFWFPVGWRQVELRLKPMPGTGGVCHCAATAASS